MSVTLVVEDGSVVTGANTFISLVDANTYHEEMGNNEWINAATEDKNVALIRATRYMCRHYKLNWKGIRYDEDQPLCWPRANVYDADEFAISATAIPQEIQWAECELALRELTTKGSLDPDLERGGRIRREKIDIIETEYELGAEPGVSIQSVDYLLSGLLESSMSVKIQRA